MAGPSRSSSATRAWRAGGARARRGNPAPVRAWRALGVGAEGRGKTGSDALEARFVGREGEMRQLRALPHAPGGGGRPPLIGVRGPAGIGKTRLAWEFL